MCKEFKRKSIGKKKILYYEYHKQTTNNPDTHNWGKTLKGNLVLQSHLHIELLVPMLLLHAKR